MRYGYYSYFRPLCNALTDSNKLVRLELEEVHQYQDDESEDVFFDIGYSEDQNEYLRRFVTLRDSRIELHDPLFESKLATILKNNGFEPLF